MNIKLFWQLLLSSLSPWATLISASDFGGDFSAKGLSGASAPGATSGTMGSQAASAMSIGTGSSGAGDYASNYKTPNYTQYTQQDFKEFMPNYQEMMNTTMGAMSGGGTNGGGAASSFTNFSSVNVMLKGFMELQKEQLEVEKAKAEASRAKVNLALEQEYDYEEEDKDEPSDSTIRQKRSAKWTSKKGKEAGSSSFGLDSGLALPLSSLSSTTEGIALLKAASATFRGKKEGKGDNLIRMKARKQRQVPSKWGSSADQWTKAGARRQTRQFWPGMSGSGGSKRETSGSQDSSSGTNSGSSGGGKEFWGKYASMFGSSGDSGKSAAPGSWSNSSPQSSGAGSASPSWAAPSGGAFQGGAGTPGAGGSSPPSFMGQGSSAGGVGAPGAFPSASPAASTGGNSQQGNQRRSLLSAYPLHGAVSLSNIPGPGSAAAASKTASNSLVPDYGIKNENIPNLSFSLNPPTEALKEDTDDEEIVKDEGRKMLMTAVKKPGVGYLMPSSYVQPGTTSYVEMAAPSPPTLFTAPITTADGPHYYGQAAVMPVDNGPIVASVRPVTASMASSLYHPPTLFYLSEKEALEATRPLLRPVSPKMMLLSPGGVAPQRLLARRGLLAAASEAEEPLVIQMTNGDNEDVKKIVLDPNNGLVLTEDTKRSVFRKKRETAEAASEAAEDIPPSNSTVAEEEEDDEADPNGHSHKTNNFKMESMMKPFMGFSKMFSRRNSAPRREELRRVKIDFSQNGAKLPEGSIETISAGGGKSPGHHEGGGLTVKVKEDEVQQRRIRIKQKPEPRKTLNFFFTW